VAESTGSTVAIRDAQRVRIATATTAGTITVIASSPINAATGTAIPMPV
jgi:hypothetical protein